MSTVKGTLLIGTVQLRGGTKAECIAKNPILAERELCLETDTKQFKVGDGVTAYIDLGYGGLQGAPGEAEGISQAEFDDLVAQINAQNAANQLEFDNLSDAIGDSVSTTQLATTVGSLNTAIGNVATAAAANVTTAVNGVRNDLSSPAGSTHVSFLPLGLNAVPLDLQKKLRLMAISPFDFSAAGDGVTDDTIAIRRAIAASVQYQRPMSLEGGVWRITDTLDFTGVPSLYSAFSSYIKVDRPGPNLQDSYAVTFGQNTGNPGTGRHGAFSLIGTLSVVCAGNRAVPQNGIFLKGSWFNIGHIHADNFNGIGIHLDSVWDSQFGRIRTERCGHADRYAITIASVGDTSNCLNICSLQCESAYHKGLYIDLLRGVIENIHCERLITTTLNDGSTQGRKTYLNHNFSLANTIIHQALIHGAPAGTVADDGVTVCVAEELNCRVYGGNATFNTVVFSGDIIMADGASTTFNDLTCEFFMQVAPSKNVVLNNAIIDELMVGNYCQVVGGLFNTVNMAYAANNISFIGSGITTIANTQMTLGSITFHSCVIGAVAQTGARASVAASVLSFANCNINEFYGTWGDVAKVSGGRIGVCNPQSQTTFLFDNIDMDSFTYTGNFGSVTTNCRCANVISWSVPTHTPYYPGSRTSRPNYVPGTPIDYISTNAQGGLTWVPTYTAPAA